MSKMCGQLRGFHGFRVFLLGLALIILATGCSLLKKKESSEVSAATFSGKKVPPEQAKAMLEDMSQNLVYGPQLGELVVNVGTSVVFPPYALYLLGNGILSISGYEPVYVSDALPEEPRQLWNATYEGVVSGPGRMIAAVAGKEFRTRELADARMQEHLEKLEEVDSSKNGGSKSVGSKIEGSKGDYAYDRARNQAGE